MTGCHGSGEAGVVKKTRRAVGGVIAGVFQWMSVGARAAAPIDGAGGLPELPSLLAYALLLLATMAIIALVVVCLMMRQQNYRLTDAQKNLHTAQDLLIKDNEVYEVRERLEAALAASDAGMFDIRYAERRVYFDERLARMLEIGLPSPITVEQFYKHIISMQAPGEDPASLQYLLEDGIIDEKIDRVRRMRLSDGSICYLRNHARTFLDPQGRPVYTAGLSIDITALKQAELEVAERYKQQELMSRISFSFMRAKDFPEALKRAVSDVAVFLEADLCCIFEHDPSRAVFVRRVHWKNPDFGGHFGDEEIIDEGRIWGRLLSREKETPTVAQGVPFSGLSGEVDLPPDDMAWVVNTPLSTESGFWGYVGVARFAPGRAWTMSDSHMMTQFAGLIATGIGRMLYQRELEQAVLTAQEASHAKGDFLSRMSHEIRTPMNAIIGMTKIAMASDDLQKYRYCLKKIDMASEGLLDLINQILDMSKIEAGKMELMVQDFDFETMVAGVCQVMSVRVDEKKLTLAVNIENGMARMFVGDEVRMRQVIMNLIGNAIKFTPENGVITLSAKEEVLGEELSRLTISVRDTGIGIKPEDKERLFHSFEQADGGTARKFGGTGLGLAISKKIVGLMNGDIWVESDYGNGSTFTFTAQVSRSKEEAQGLRLEEGVDPGALRVLAVDDVSEIREYFAHIMEGFHIACDVAENGHCAIDCVNNSVKQGRPYNVAFIDYMMPGIDGLETAASIKKMLGDDVAVVMVSQIEWDEIRDRAHEIGIERFIQKPLFPSTLLNSINEVMGAKAKKKSEARHETPRLDGKRILLVEDVEINREIVMSFLEGTNATVECAHDGQVALNRFSADPARYDIIFMDVHMPVMDGYEATARIRALPVEKARTVPIVAMTANVFREDVEKCLEAGMNDHIGKPIDAQLLQKKLREYLL